jgi:acyl-CoA dehydrogenase
MEPVADYIDGVLSGAFATKSAPHEAAWHAIWHAHALGELDPIASAFVGGAMADRLSWVFVSGYQAALRRVFPVLPTHGWAAFAATESKDDPALSGTQLSVGEDTQAMLLNGNKSWVAQSRKVQHLLISARPHAPIAESPTECVWVDANAPGVALSHRTAPTFLADLSQGFVEFVDVTVASGRVLPRGSARTFGRTEPRFVMMAACGHMLAHAHSAHPTGQLQHLVAQLTTVSLALAECARQEHIPALPMAQLDAVFIQCVDEFVHAGLCHQIASWDADTRLLRMYSGRIRARADKTTTDKPRADGARTDKI